MEHSTNRPSAATDFTQGAAWKPPNQLGQMAGRVWGKILTPKQPTARLTKPSNYTTPCMRSSISA